MYVFRDSIILQVAQAFYQEYWVNLLSKAGLSLQGYTIFTNFDFDLSTHNTRTNDIRGLAIFVSHKLSASKVSFVQNDFKDHVYMDKNSLKEI